VSSKRRQHKSLREEGKRKKMGVDRPMKTEKKKKSVGKKLMGGGKSLLNEPRRKTEISSSSGKGRNSNWKTKKEKRNY